MKQSRISDETENYEKYCGIARGSVRQISLTNARLDIEVIEGDARVHK